MRLTGIGLCIATLAVSGCGVLFTSLQSHVPLSSTPTGAQILVDGNHVRTVRGSVSGQEVVGQVTEGGSLFLPLPTTDGTSVIELRLMAAGLVVASEPVRGVPEPLRVRQWVRPGSATASPDD